MNGQDVEPTRDVFYTTCPYNCWPVNCGMALKVKDGKVVSIEGNSHHEIGRGRLCVKGQSASQIIYSDKRLLYPMEKVKIKKRKESWKRVSWEKALNTIASRMMSNIRSGRREANALYHSHGNIVQRVNWSILAPRFANILGMTLWDGNFICWYDVGVGQTLSGYWGRMDPLEMGEHSQCLINWAQDPAASMANMVQDIIKLKERGGKVITIDPRVTQTAALSDIHIKPRPGTDAALANAIANMIVRANLYDRDFVQNHSYGFEWYSEFLKDYTLEYAAAVTGVPEEEIQQLAMIMAKTKPLCLNLSRGALGKHSNGFIMVHAILCAFALTGNIGKIGGGTIWGESIEFNESLQLKERRPTRSYPANNLNSIIKALESGQVDVLLILGANPLAQWPEYERVRNALKKVNLIAAWDLFENKTIREVAHFALPATSWAEELGLRATIKKVYLMEKAIEPPGECVECSEFLKHLAGRLNHREDFFPWETKEEFLNEALKCSACAGMTVNRLRRRPGGLESPEMMKKPYSNFVFRSPSSKFEFYSSVAEPLRLPPLPRHTEPFESEGREPEKARKYPFLLISSRKNTHFHSFHDSHAAIGLLKELEPEPVLQLNPLDAGVKGIKDGDYVVIYNARGQARLKVELTHEVPRGMVSMNNCWPELNAVTPCFAPLQPEVTRALGCGGEPSYQDARVQIRKA